MMRKSYLRYALTTMALICIIRVGYAQIPDINGIYIGDYSLDFKKSREAKMTIQLPSEFQSNFIGWSPSSWPSYDYGITGFSIQPCMVSRYDFLGSEINIWVNGHMWDGQERIQLIIDTNKPCSFPYGYYYLYANIDIINLD